MTVEKSQHLRGKIKQPEAGEDGGLSRREALVGMGGGGLLAILTAYSAYRILVKKEDPVVKGRDGDLVNKWGGYEVGETNLGRVQRVSFKTESEFEESIRGAIRGIPMENAEIGYLVAETDKKGANSFIPLVKTHGEGGDEGLYAILAQDNRGRIAPFSNRIFAGIQPVKLVGSGLSDEYGASRIWGPENPDGNDELIMFDTSGGWRLRLPNKELMSDIPIPGSDPLRQFLGVDE
jgi:hypothetical protein